MFAAPIRPIFTVDSGEQARELWLEEGSLDEIERRLSGVKVTRLVVSDIE